MFDKVNTKFAAMITKCRLEHSHHLNQFTFELHPSNRASLDDDSLHTVDELRKAGSKKASILKFIVDNSDSNPTCGAGTGQNLVISFLRNPTGSDWRI